MSRKGEESGFGRPVDSTSNARQSSRGTIDGTTNQYETMGFDYSRRQAGGSGEVTSYIIYDPATGRIVEVGGQDPNPRD